MINFSVLTSPLQKQNKMATMRPWKIRTTNVIAVNRFIKILPQLQFILQMFSSISSVKLIVVCKFG